MCFAAAGPTFGGYGVGLGEFFKARGGVVELVACLGDRIESLAVSAPATDGPWPKLRVITRMLRALPFQPQLDLNHDASIQHEQCPLW